MSTTPRVWVGCLACYNGGLLMGEWFDATDAPDDTASFNEAMRAKPREGMPRPYGAHYVEAHEEFWVFDHEGFEGFLRGECSPCTAREIAECIERIDEGRMPAFRAFCSNEGETPGPDNIDDLVERFEDSFCGYFDSERDYAYDLAVDIGAYDDDSSRWPLSCVDWDHAWNELRVGGDNWSEYVSGTGYAIFRSY